MCARKPGSRIRQNIINILYIIGKAHPYKIAKIYNRVFPKVSTRVIYYHLKKGASLGLFNVAEIKTTQGQYSWGNRAERIYYVLGDNAVPTIEPLLYAKIEEATKQITKEE